MRKIEISVDVFAKIWSLRNAGEDTENEILQRVLEEFSYSKIPVRNENSSGLLDKRYGVVFPEGFEIFRNYKGIEHRAKVVCGQWEVDRYDGRFFTLNELSKAIGTKVENAWKNWFFQNEDGEKMAVSELRNPKSIQRKNRPNESNSTMASAKKARWCDDVFEALKELGGRDHLSKIYAKVIEIRTRGGRSVPKNTEAVIRKELETRSSDSESFDADRAEDWFEICEGKGSGIWGIRARQQK